MAAILSTQGDSTAWRDKKTKVVRLFNEKFRPSSEGRQSLPTWELLQESQACSPELYAGFAYFVVNEYIIPPGQRNAGSFLSCNVAINYLCMLLNMACSKFKSTGSDSTKLFFTCLDVNASTEAANWLRGLKKKMTRIVFERCKKDGTELDQSAPPLYTEHVELLSAAYAKEGSCEAAVRKFAINTCLRAGGRASEPAFMTMESMEWDIHFHAVYGELPQSKPSKVKLVAFCAGKSRHSCWFLDFADYLSLRPEIEPEDPTEADAVSWLCPELHRSSDPAKRLGDWIKALQPKERGGAARYAALAIDVLPDGCNASSLRAGVCNALRAQMPTELAVATTGHDLKSMSAFFEYVDADRALLVPGSLVLAGWDPLPWGQVGDSPSPACLAPLDPMLDMSVLTLAINELFRLHDHCPSFLRPGGKLRPAIEAAFATLIMYYPDRSTHGEMSEVNVLLIKALVKFGLLVIITRLTLPFSRGVL